MLKVFQLNREHPMPEATPIVIAYKEHLVVPENHAQTIMEQLNCKPDLSSDMFPGHRALARGFGEMNSDEMQMLIRQAEKGCALFGVIQNGTIRASMEIYEDGTRSRVHINFSFLEEVN